MNFNIKQSEYFDHPYNNTIQNERAIEIPIALRYFEKFGKLNNFIELGAVLPYYLKNANHCCIDPIDPKATILEYAENIDYTNKHILSISTIEHIGTSDYGLEVNKSICAFEILNQIYTKSITCLISWPIGYNVDLDNKVFHESNIKCVYFKKKGKLVWEIQKKRNMDGVKYDFPYKFGNGLIWAYKDFK
jgi:hypothetical protein